MGTLDQLNKNLNWDSGIGLKKNSLDNPHEQPEWRTTINRC